jgi:hypothetical protein
MRNSKEEKLKMFLQGNLTHGQSLRSEEDHSKFFNGGRCHIFDKRSQEFEIVINVDLTLIVLGSHIFFLKCEK